MNFINKKLIKNLINRKLIQNFVNKKLIVNLLNKKNKNEFYEQKIKSKFTSLIQKKENKVFPLRITFQFIGKKNKINVSTRNKTKKIE